MAENLRIESRTGAPGPEDLQLLRALAADSQTADGAPPFSEQTLVELGKDRSAPDLAPLTVVYAWAGDDLAGAAVVIHDHHKHSVETLTELTVDPQHRRRGIGSQLAGELADSVLAPHPGASHRAWAHGGHPGGPKLASAFSWGPVRELWRMRLANDVELPAVQLDEDMTLESFQPGTDEQTWLKANAQAFSDHPEQGRLTLADMEARKAEDWFDPQGFLLARSRSSGEGLLGFHWTKIHPAEESEGEKLGEVYVVGVVPAAQGRGLGASLTLAGIDYLRSQGVDAVILYVDASNTSAAALYKKLGFQIWDIDIQYAPAADTEAEHPTASG